MGGTAKSQLRGRRAAAGLAAKGDPGWVKWLITGASLCFLLLFLGVPLVAVFAEALRKGLGAYLESFQNRDALSAIRLTLLVAAIAVPLNLVFGLAASWAIAKFEFRGKSLLVTLIVVKVPYQRWRTAAVPIAILAGGAMLLPFAPGIGAEINDATSWVRFGGISFQPSEFLKLAAIGFLVDILGGRLLPTRDVTALAHDREEHAQRLTAEQAKARVDVAGEDAEKIVDDPRPAHDYRPSSGPGVDGAGVRPRNRSRVSAQMPRQAASLAAASPIS